MKSKSRKNTHVLFSIATAAILLIGSITANSHTDATSAPEEPRFLDELFLLIETEIPGFAGYYYDDERLNVYLTQPVGVTNLEIRDVLSDYLDATDLAKGIIVEQATYSWKTWNSWRTP